MCIRARANLNGRINNLAAEAITALPAPHDNIEVTFTHIVARSTFIHTHLPQSLRHFTHV